MAPNAPIGAARTMILITPKKTFAIAIDDGVDPLAELAETRDGEAGEDRNQQDLQQIAPGESADEGVGDDRQQMGDEALLLGAIDVARDRIGIERGRIDVEALCRAAAACRPRARSPAPAVDDRLEIEQRLDADTPDLLEVAHRADAVHDRAEDDRRDHHLDERR